MKRREAVKLITISGLAATTAAAQHAGHGAHTAGSSAASNSAASNSAATVRERSAPALEYFSPHEFAVLSRLSDLIIPNDGTPGALDAKVPEYIDAQVAHMPEAQVRLSGGIQWLDRHCNEGFGKPFLECSAEQQKGVLDLVADGKEVARDLRAARVFFVQLRNLVCDGFYSSKLGFAELEYKGNVFVTTFEGCTHPEHG